jgi:hypothetical protein
MSEAFRAMIFVALIGSHLAMVVPAIELSGK